MCCHSNIEITHLSRGWGVVLTEVSAKGLNTGALVAPLPVWDYTGQYIEITHQTGCLRVN